MACDRIGKEIGTYKCWSCLEPGPVRQKSEEAGGSLSAACMWCGFANVAKRGTKHYAILDRQVTRLAADPAAAADPAKTADPAAAAAGAEKPQPAAADKKPAVRSFAAPLFGGS